MHDGLVVKRHVVVYKFTESIELLLVGQVSRQQQKRNLLKSETLLCQQRRHEVVKLIATIEQFAVGGTQFPVLATLISHHVSYVCQSHEHATAVLVTQSALHAIFWEQLIVDLARVLDLVRQLIYQIILVHVSLLVFRMSTPCSVFTLLFNILFAKKAFSSRASCFHANAPTSSPPACRQTPLCRGLCRQA